VVTNGQDGSISGGGFGVLIAGRSGVVTNQGTIIGGGPGIAIVGGGVVTNSQGGLISGGVEISDGSGTVTNAGTISGVAESVVFASGTTNNLLVIDPGAVFNGAVDATAGSGSTIELSNGIGTINGIGTGQFDGFDKLVADARTTWTVAGSNTIGTVLDLGTLDVSGECVVSKMVDSNSTGSFQLMGASTLEVAADLGSSAKISFEPGSELVIDSFGLFGQRVGSTTYAGSLLENFGGSTIDLKDFSISGLSMSFSKGTGLLQLTNSASQLATLDFQGSSLGNGTFHFGTDGSAGVLITHS